MEVIRVVGKDLPLGIVISLMVLLHATQHGATATSVTEFHLTPSIAHNNLELEFLFDSDIGRLLGSSGTGTGGTSDPNKPAVCDRLRYTDCLPNQNKPPKKGENSGLYNRGR